LYRVNICIIYIYIYCGYIWIYHDISFALICNFQRAHRGLAGPQRRVAGFNLPAAAQKRWSSTGKKDRFGTIELSLSTYWCLVGNGWEWGNGMIIDSYYGSFPHSLLSTSKIRHKPSVINPMVNSTWRWFFSQQVGVCQTIGLSPLWVNINHWIYKPLDLPNIRGWSEKYLGTSRSMFFFKKKSSIGRKWGDSPMFSDKPIWWCNHIHNNEHGVLDWWINQLQQWRETWKGAKKSWHLGLTVVNATCVRMFKGYVYVFVSLFGQHSSFLMTLVG